MTFKCRYGDFNIKAESDLISMSLRKYGEWAQLEIDVLSEFICPGDTVLDVGAYIGTHSRAFSNMVGPRGAVLAFEPSPATFQILSDNVAVAPFANIQIFQFGLGAAEELRSFNVCEEDFNAGAMRLVETAQVAHMGRVEVKTLDSLKIPNVRFIKADVEDMELMVLHGGSATISVCNPIIFIEVNSLEASSGVLLWARQFSYLAFGVLSPAFNPENFNHVSENMFGIANEVGLLLIHKDVHESYRKIIENLSLPEIQTIDDLAMLMFYKPQYASEILFGSDVAKKLGANFTPVEFEKMHDRVVELEQRIACSEAAQAFAERLATERQALIMAAEDRIIATEKAKNNAEALVFSRQALLSLAEQQILEIDRAKSVAELLAYERQAALVDANRREVEMAAFIQEAKAKIAEIEKAKDFAEGLAYERLSTITELTHCVAATERANESAEILARAHMQTRSASATELPQAEVAESAAEQLVPRRALELQPGDSPRVPGK